VIKDSKRKAYILKGVLRIIKRVIAVCL